MFLPERSMEYSLPDRGNLTFAIVDRLGAAIVSGKYSGNNPFPIEAELIRHFGVSRNVLREAVKMLTAKGLLGARPRQGTWIQPEKAWNLLDPDVLRWLLDRRFQLSLLIEFTELRLTIEPAAAGLAAIRATTEDRSAIRHAIARMYAAERGDDDPLNSDIAFHVAILAASRNRFYERLRDFIATALRYSIRATNHYKRVPLASVSDHNAIAEAILSGNAEAAAKAMRVLISEALNLMNAAHKRDLHEKYGTLASACVTTR